MTTLTEYYKACEVADSFRKIAAERVEQFLNSEHYQMLEGVHLDKGDFTGYYVDFCQVIGVDENDEVLVWLTSWYPNRDSYPIKVPASVVSGEFVY